MSHSRSQSRPPPKNPLPARFFRGAQVFSSWLLPQLSYILYLISYILYLHLTDINFQVLQPSRGGYYPPARYNLTITNQVGRIRTMRDSVPFNQTLSILGYFHENGSSSNGSTSSRSFGMKTISSDCVSYLFHFQTVAGCYFAIALPLLMTLFSDFNQLFYLCVLSCHTDNLLSQFLFYNRRSLFLLSVGLGTVQIRKTLEIPLFVVVLWPFYFTFDRRHTWEKLHAGV